MKVAKNAKKNRPPLDGLDAAAPGGTAEAAREVNDAATGDPLGPLFAVIDRRLMLSWLLLLHTKLPQLPAGRVS